MKRNIFITLFCFVTALCVQSQELTLSNGETIELGSDKVRKIIFDSSVDNNNGNDLLFVRESGDSITFDIGEIASLDLADDYNTAIEQIEYQSGKAVITYESATATIHIIGCNEEEGIIRLFNLAGKLVKATKGHTLCLSELPAGLYIASYNNKLNAKILKK